MYGDVDLREPGCWVYPTLGHLRVISTQLLVWLVMGVYLHVVVAYRPCLTACLMASLIAVVNIVVSTDWTFPLVVPLPTTLQARTCG